GQGRWRPPHAAAGPRKIRGICGSNALGGPYRLRLSAGAQRRLRQGLGPGLDADAFTFRSRLLGGVDGAGSALDRRRLGFVVYDADAVGGGGAGHGPDRSAGGLGVVTPEV